MKQEFIKTCMRQAQKDIRPFIPQAVESAAKLYNITYSNADIAKVIMLAGDFHNSVKTTKNPSDFEVLLKFNPETAIITDMLISEISPIAEEIRARLFSDQKPPFPEDIIKAMNWIHNESKCIPQEIVRKLQQTPGSKRIELIRNTIPAYIDRKAKLLPGQMISIKFEPLTIPYRDSDGIRKHVQIFKGTKLFFLAETVRQLVENTGFSQDSLITFILTGIKPYFPSIKVKTGMKRFGYVQVEFHRGMDYEEFLFLHRKLKRLFQRKKTLNENHLDIFRLVSLKGGIPKKNKTKFWYDLLNEWNEAHPNDTYSNPNSLRITYNRIINNFNIDLSNH